MPQSRSIFKKPAAVVCVNKYCKDKKLIIQGGELVEVSEGLNFKTDAKKQRCVMPQSLKIFSPKVFLSSM